MKSRLMKKNGKEGKSGEERRDGELKKRKWVDYGVIIGFD